MCCTLSQSYTIFVYRGAYAPLLYSYCGVSTGHITTYVQAHVVNDFLTLESIKYYLDLPCALCYIVVAMEEVFFFCANFLVKEKEKN